MPEQTSQKRAIQQAALELFARRGYHGASMQNLAQSVGLSKATLYWHFPSKEELFRSIYRDFILEIHGPLHTAVETPGPADDKLRSIVEITLDMARENTDSIRLLLQLTAQAEIAETVAHLGAEELKAWTDILAPLFAELGDPDPPATVQLFAATLDGLMSHILVSPELVDTDKVVATVNRCFLTPQPPKQSC